MEVYHIHQLTQDFDPQDTLDFKFDTLMDVAEHFRMDYREDTKRDLKENLCDKLKSLISEYKDRVAKLKSTLASLR